VRHHIKRILRNVAGFSLLLLGIVGLFLPFLQGILFIVLGLSLIDVPAKHRLHRWLRGRWRCYRAIAVRYMRVRRAIRLRRAQRREQAAAERDRVLRP
jgi:uncharacterized membrane protein YbaN (DUF454 family)